MTKIEMIITILVSILGSTGLFTFIQFLIIRKDKKNDELESINKKIDTIVNEQMISKIDRTRTHLLLLIKSYPHNHEEINKVAHKYFIELKSNWICEPIFEEWCKKEKIDQPSWYINRGQHDK